MTWPLVYYGGVVGGTRSESAAAVWRRNHSWSRVSSLHLRPLRPAPPSSASAAHAIIQKFLRFTRPASRGATQYTHIAGEMSCDNQRKQILQTYLFLLPGPAWTLSGFMWQLHILCRQRWTLGTAVTAGASTGSSWPADQTGPSSIQGHNMDIMCLVGIILALLSLSTHADCYWRCCACIQLFLKFNLIFQTLLHLMSHVQFCFVTLTRF